MKQIYILAFIFLFGTFIGSSNCQNRDAITDLYLKVLSSNAFDFTKIAKFLLNNPSYLDKLNTKQATDYISSNKDLSRFVNTKSDGTKYVDWVSLLKDKGSIAAIQNIINQKLASIKSKRLASVYDSDFNEIAELILNDPEILAKLNTGQATEFISTIPYLQQFIMSKDDGYNYVDWISLLNDPVAKNILANLTSDYVTVGASARQVVIQLPDFSNINSIMSIFTPLFNRLQAQLTNQTQKFISATFQSLVGELTASVFSGKAIDYNSIIQKVLNQLSASIMDGVSSEFQTEAQNLLNTEFGFLNDLLSLLDAQQIIPPLFIDFIKSNSQDFKNELQTYIPVLASLITNAIDTNLIGSLFSQIDFNNLVG
jgi:hypothetical protein